MHHTTDAVKRVLKGKGFEKNVLITDNFKIDSQKVVNFAIVCDFFFRFAIFHKNKILFKNNKDSLTYFKNV